VCLCTEGKIDHVWVERRENFEALANHVGVELTMKMQHKHPPYQPSIRPELLARIDGTYNYKGRTAVATFMESETDV
jgi:hypothetical protein